MQTGIFESHCLKSVKQTIITVRSSNDLWFSFLFPVNPVNILSINLLGRRLSLCITMGCTALFFLLLNICTSRYSGSDYGSCSRVCSAEGRTSGILRSPACQASNSCRSEESL